MDDWKPPADLLDKVYAEMAMAKLGAPTTENLMCLMGHAGLLVAAGKSKPGELVQTTSYELSTQMGMMVGWMRGSMNTLCRTLSPLATLLSHGGEQVLPNILAENQQIKEAVSFLNYAVYSSWGLEPRRTCWHPIADGTSWHWPEYLSLVDNIRAIWAGRRPLESELSEKRFLVRPELRPKIWWNYEEHWEGHKGRHVRL